MYCTGLQVGSEALAPPLMKAPVEVSSNICVAARWNTLVYIERSILITWLEDAELGPLVTNPHTTINIDEKWFVSVRQSCLLLLSLVLPALPATLRFVASPLKYSSPPICTLYTMSFHLWNRSKSWFSLMWINVTRFIIVKHYKRK